MAKKCELCPGEAKTHCESDGASLCWDCDGRVHGANFLVAKHRRTLLCRLCHSATPWSASGPSLSPTVSLCPSCLSAYQRHHRHDSDKDDNDDQSLDDEEGEDEDEDEDDDEEEVDDDDGDEDEIDDDDDDDDDDENQVVPWSKPARSVSSSSSSTTTTNTSSIPSHRIFRRQARN